MIDSVGREIKTGDVVEIKGAYFANENGLWFVERSPGDPSWLGDDYSLRKLCKNGKLSVGSKKITFWPLKIYTNCYEKRVLGNAWNDEHATISVVDGMDRRWIREHFETEANEMDRDLAWCDRNFGLESEDAQRVIRRQKFLRSVAAGIA